MCVSNWRASAIMSTRASTTLTLLPSSVPLTSGHQIGIRRPAAVSRKSHRPARELTLRRIDQLDAARSYNTFDSLEPGRNGTVETVPSLTMVMVELGWKAIGPPSPYVYSIPRLHMPLALTCRLPLRVYASCRSPTAPLSSPSLHRHIKIAPVCWRYRPEIGAGGGIHHECPCCQGSLNTGTARSVLFSER